MEDDARSMEGLAAFVNGQLDSPAIELVFQCAALWRTKLDKLPAQQGHSLDDVGKFNVDANPLDLPVFREGTSTTSDFPEFGGLESRVERVFVLGSSDGRKRPAIPS